MLQKIIFNTVFFYIISFFEGLNASYTYEIKNLYIKFDNHPDILTQKALSIYNSTFYERLKIEPTNIVFLAYGHYISKNNDDLLLYKHNNEYFSTYDTDDWYCRINSHDHTIKNSWNPRQLNKDDSDEMFTLAQIIETFTSPEPSMQYSEKTTRVFTQLVYQNTAGFWGKIPIICFDDRRFDRQQYLSLHNNHRSYGSCYANTYLALCHELEIENDFVKKPHSILPCTQASKNLQTLFPGEKVIENESSLTNNTAIIQTAPKNHPQKNSLYVPISISIIGLQSIFIIYLLYKLNTKIK